VDSGSVKIVTEAWSFCSGFAVSAEPTTAAVQRYLDALAGDQPAEPIVRALLDRSGRRLRVVCGTLLYRQYRRLTLPPLNLQPDELLGAVVGRLRKALRTARPQTVRRSSPWPASTGAGS
jgi:RNA polymerase sigma-70 factor (ECF subfamily)